MIHFNQSLKKRLAWLMALLAGWLLLVLLAGIQPTVLAAGQEETVTPQLEGAGFGILGDSNSDEYRGSANRGGDYSNTTFNWAEQLQLSRGLYFGPWENWGEPRRVGYEYNWARSGATTQDMIDEGQHTGLAEQVAAGKVEYVFVWIGGNDFTAWNDNYQEIYDGTLSDAELQVKVNSIIANITTAVDTILAAGDVRMVVATIGDQADIPEMIDAFPDPAKRQRVTDAINEVNAGVRAMAGARDIGIADVHQFTADLLARVDKSGYLTVGGERIRFTGRGNEPHYLRLDDSVGHIGTVGSGIIANELFVKPFNEKYGLGLEPLSDEEILENAGISPAARQSNCPGGLSWLATLLTLITGKRLAC